jgi:predicted N-acetyltransferase YhbS
MSEFEFCRLLSSETWPLRARVLWPEKEPGEACRLAVDDQAGVLHFGIRRQGEVVAIGSFIPQTHPELAAVNYRLRAMATDLSCRNMGLGRMLIEGALEVLKSMQVNGVWADARHGALGFYARLDWDVTGASYDVPKRGRHRLVWVRIDD